MAGRRSSTPTNQRDMLFDITLAAIMAMARPPAVDPVLERSRLEALAGDIAGVVEERDELAHWLPGAELQLPTRGPWAREQAALALVVIASHESGFAADVADCRRVGTDHPSVTAYQLLGPFALEPYTVAEVCYSPRRAAERALAVLAHHAHRCGGIERAFHGYASGACRRPSRAGREMIDLWRHAVWRMR